MRKDAQDKENFPEGEIDLHTVDPSLVPAHQVRTKISVWPTIDFKYLVLGGRTDW